MRSGVQGVGDKHPGQYLPFWIDACRKGNARACDYASQLAAVYCNNGSGWACNEVGIQLLSASQHAAPTFKRACNLGFSPACENVNRTDIGPQPLARAGPLLGDLPIVLK